MDVRVQMVPACKSDLRSFLPVHPRPRATGMASHLFTAEALLQAAVPPLLTTSNAPPPPPLAAESAAFGALATPSDTRAAVLAQLVESPGAKLQTAR